MAALYVIVLKVWRLIPSNTVALADFFLFRIPLRQPYSPTFCVIRSIFELHRVMKSPESLVTKHVLQGVPELRNVWFVCLSHFVTNATWSIVGAAGYSS